jgi:hypothetical protein
LKGKLELGIVKILIKGENITTIIAEAEKLSRLYKPGIKRKRRIYIDGYVFRLLDAIGFCNPVIIQVNK